MTVVHKTYSATHAGLSTSDTKIAPCGLHPLVGDGSLTYFALGHRARLSVDKVVLFDRLVYG